MSALRSLPFSSFFSELNPQKKQLPAAALASLKEKYILARARDGSLAKNNDALATLSFCLCRR